MPFYDTLLTPSQLGGNLQVASSHGWPYTDYLTHWDSWYRLGNTYSGPETNEQFSEAMVDMLVFNDELHVAWIEPEWDGSQQTMRGPFVKKWNGAAWVSLGSEIDPTLTPIALSSDPAVTGTVGTHGAPANPLLATDGTSLWCGYTVREVAIAANPPPSGVFVPGHACGCYTPTCDPADYAHWYPRKAYLRKWNGASWDLFGELDAQTNNRLGTNNSTNSGGLAPDLSLWVFASAADPGNVYMALFEAGAQSSLPGWIISPACIFGIQFGTFQWPPMYRGLRVGVFNTGTGPSGTVKTLGTQTSPFTTSGFSYTYTGSPPSARPVRGGNDGGTPFLMYTRSNDGDLVLVNWTTNAVVQSYNGSGDLTLAPPQSWGHDTTTAKFYFMTQWTIGQTKDDGTGAFEDFLNNIAYYTPFNDFPVFSQRMVPELANGDLWAANMGGTYPRQNVSFHENCPAWTAWGSSFTGALAPIGDMIPVLHNDVLYVAGAFYNPSDPTADYTVRVFAANVCRNCASCRVPNPDMIISSKIEMQNTVPGTVFAGTGSTGSGIVLTSVVDSEASSGATGSTGPTGAAGVVLNSMFPL
jgi:hypothetical protein